MRLLIIRHGDPDYEQDSLTPQGLGVRQSFCPKESPKMKHQRFLRFSFGSCQGNRFLHIA